MEKMPSFEICEFCKKNVFKNNERLIERVRIENELRNQPTYCFHIWYDKIKPKIKNDITVNISKKKNSMTKVPKNIESFLLITDGKG